MTLPGPGKQAPQGRNRCVDTLEALMVRISVNVTTEQADALAKRAEETGVLQSEQIRRAITAWLGDPKPPVTRQPLLFVQKAGQ